MQSMTHRVFKWSALRLLALLVVGVTGTEALAQPSPSAPGFVPLIALNFSDAVPGTPMTNFGGGGGSCANCKSVISSEVPGPFDDGPVVKQFMPSATYVFGGEIAKFKNLGEGQEIWVRWYEYLPDTFCLANGTANADGGSAAIKWMRFQYSNGSRVTYEPDAKGSCTAPCTQCLTAIKPDFIAGEGMQWKERYGNMNYWLRDTSPTFPIGQWHALQVYMKISAGSSDKGDGNGLVRIWIDDTFVGEQTRNTLPAQGTLLDGVWMGNYWNGGAPKDQGWYVDELVITTDPPKTIDSQGRPFIHPLTRVSQLMGASPPSAPSIEVQ